jgi:septum site-determining protein MinD
VGLLAQQSISARLIVNRLSPEMVKKGDMLSQDDVIEILSLELLGAVPLDGDIVVSTNKGTPATLDARSPAAKAFERIAKRIDGGEVVEDDERVGFFTRLGRALGLSPA